MRILLVEDNSDHRELMRLALTGHDATWQVEGVVSGGEALRLLLGGEVFDLVFLDYSLPQRDGLWFLGEILRGKASPPVVMVTGRGDEGVAVEAMKRGAYDYVVKQEGYLERLPVVARHAMEVNRMAMERKQTEEALKKGEERFHTSVETLLEGFAIFSAVRDSHGQLIDFKYEFINEIGCKMNQKAREEHIGGTLLKLFPEEKEIGLFDDYVEVIETGQPLVKEHVIYEPVYGGSDRLKQAFDVRISRLEDGIVVTWQDITEKKRGEELLRQSEERLKRLIENSKDIIVMADLDGEVLYYNGPPGYGVRKEDVLGKNPFSIFEPAIAASLMNQLKLVIKGGEALTFENMIPWRGESFWFFNQMYPIRDEKGRMIAVGLIARNTTERRQAEEALRESEENFKALAENANDGIVIGTGEGGWHVYANRRAVEITGYPIEELLKTRIRDLAHPDELPKLTERYKERLAGLEVPKPYETALLNKDGIKVPVEISPSKTTWQNQPADMVILHDITERKRAEEALKKSAQFLRDTGEMAKVGGWELDLSTEEVSWTEEVGRIHGVEPGYRPKLEEAIKFYAPESIPALKATLKKTTETGEPYDLESLFIPSGSKDKIWVRSLGRAVYSGGKIVKLTGTFQNIDKYKRAEEALRVSLEKYRVLFESFPLGITISDKSGKIIEGNLQSEPLLGIAREAHAQRRIDSKEWQIIRKDGTPMPVDEYASTRALGENRLIENVEMGIVKDKGEITWISVTAAPIPLEGYGVAIAYGDITERKRVEEALRRKSGEQALLLDNIQTQVWYLTDEETYGTVNKARAEFFGKKNEEMENKKLYDVLSKNEAEICMSGYVEVFEKRKRIHTEEWIANAKGEKRLLSIIKSPKLDENGDIEYVVCSAEDITERKRDEEQLKNSTEQLRALSTHLQSIREEERTLMAREIHDELGQELTGLKMDLTWLVRRLSKNQKSLISKTESMLKLVDSTIQTVRRISSELRPGVLDDLGLIAAIEWQTQDFENRTGITCVFSSSLEEIDLDRDRSTAVFRIFQETMTNVSRHANATRVNITLEKSADTLMLRIDDNGRGIKESEVSHPKSLGLLGMRERVFVFGGEVEISGIPGKGTTVTVTIPIKKE